MDKIAIEEREGSRWTLTVWMHPLAPADHRYTIVACDYWGILTTERYGFRRSSEAEQAADELAARMEERAAFIARLENAVRELFTKWLAENPAALRDEFFSSPELKKAWLELTGHMFPYLPTPKGCYEIRHLKPELQLA